MCARLRDAWRTPRDAHEPDAAEELLRGPAPDPGDPSAMMRGHLQTERNDENQRRRDLAGARYRDNLQNAWQQGRTDPREADRIERQGEQWRHGR